ACRPVQGSADTGPDSTDPGGSAGLVRRYVHPMQTDTRHGKPARGRGKPARGRGKPAGGRGKPARGRGKPARGTASRHSTTTETGTRPTGLAPRLRSLDRPAPSRTVD